MPWGMAYRGELEKIIARMESQPYRDDDERHEYDRHDERRRSSHRDRNNGGRGYRREGEYKNGGKKREGFLSISLICSVTESLGVWDGFEAKPGIGR